LDEKPPVTDLGSDGTQSATQEKSLASPPAAPFDSLPVLSRVSGIVESNPRALGSGIATAFVMGYMQQAHSEAAELKQEIVRLRERVSQVERELRDCREERVTLTAALSSERSARRVGNVCIAIAVALLGLGIDQATEKPVLALLLGLVGFSLLVIGWKPGILGGDR
jgi:hypothetical protein